MAAQSNYTYETPKSVPGAKADLALDVVISRRNEEADGVMKFGMAVAVGKAAGAGIKVPTKDTTAEQIEGVVIAKENTEHNMQGKVVIPQNDECSVMTKGDIWARLADKTAPAYNAPAYVFVDGDNAGEFTATAADGKTVDIGAKFGKDADVDNGIAVVIL